MIVLFSWLSTLGKIVALVVIVDNIHFGFSLSMVMCCLCSWLDVIPCLTVV